MCSFCVFSKVNVHWRELLVSDWFSGFFVDFDDEEGKKEIVKKLRKPNSGEADSADVVVDVDDVGVALGCSIC